MQMAGQGNVIAFPRQPGLYLREKCAQLGWRYFDSLPQGDVCERPDGRITLTKAGSTYLAEARPSHDRPDTAIEQGSLDEAAGKMRRLPGGMALPIQDSIVPSGRDGILISWEGGTGTRLTVPLGTDLPPDYVPPHGRM